MSGREELLALSEKMAHDYVAWVEGRMSQTQFVVDMAQHLLDLKTIALTRPQPADGGDWVVVPRVADRAMVDAGYKHSGHAAMMYAAMIAAAPKPEVVQQAWKCGALVATSADLYASQGEE